jgi:hypothetical protein
MHDEQIHDKRERFSISGCSGFVGSILNIGMRIVQMRQHGFSFSLPTNINSGAMEEAPGHYMLAEGFENGKLHVNIGNMLF